MAIRIIGIMLVISSTTVIGIYYSYKNDYRLLELEELSKVMNMLLSEIEYGISTLPEAIGVISERIEGPIKLILSECREQLTEKKGQGINELWCNAIDKKNLNTYMNKNDINHLKDMGKILGYGDRELLNRGIKSVTDYIDNEISNIHELNKKNKKMYQSLGLLSGVLLVIVLI